MQLSVVQYFPLNTGNESCGVPETSVSAVNMIVYIHKWSSEGTVFSSVNLEIYLLTGWCGLRGLPGWRAMSSAAEHHRHAGRCSSTVGAE